MTPPDVWRRLLRWSLDADRRADVEADLAEEFDLWAAQSPARARRWYRRQVVAFVARRIFRAPRWWSATDVRLAVRLARRQPVATLTSILALAAVIGLSIAAFTFARSFVFPDLRLPSGDRLGRVVMNRAAPGASDHPRPAEVLAWMRGARTAASIGAFQFASPPLQIEDGDARPVDAAFITPGPFARLAPAPLKGRLLIEADTQRGATPVVVIGESLWRGRLAADPGVIGRTIRIAGELRTIVGVLPAGFAFPVRERAWMPLSIEAIPSAGTPRLVVWTITAPSHTRADVAAEFGVLAAHVIPETERAGTSVSVLSYVDGFTGGSASAGSALVLSLLLVFLCAVSLNVANLMLARCAARSGELAMRAALGASRARIVGQLFVESLVTSGAAALIGIVGVQWLLGWIRAQAGGRLPFWLDLTLDTSVVAYAVLLAIVASTLTGIVPALRITRGQAPGSGARVASVALGRFAASLLAVQLAASLALLATAGLLAEGLGSFAQRSPAADESRVLTAVLYRDAGVSAARPRWGSPELVALRLELERALAGLPGAERAAVSLSVPRADKNIGIYETESRPGVPIRLQQVLAGPGFFETLSVPLRSGRVFTQADARPDAHPVAVVSEQFVTAAFGGRAVVGQRIREVRADGTAAAPWLEIVGVVPDLAMAPGDRTTRGEIFEPLIGTDFMYASVKATVPPLALESAMRAAIARTDPRIRVTDVQPLTDVGWETRATLRGGTGVLGVLGLLTLMLSLAGMYALASLSVTSRTREIGIRLALGGSARDVLAPVLGRTIRQLGTGAAAGALLAVILGRLVANMPFAIPGSTGVFVPLAAVLLVSAGLAAVWAPARRALRISPSDALRGD
jgi:predicted permease